MPAPSLRGLARQLGLSVATVSLALRHSAHVAWPTKRRILQAARRCGYRPNALVGSVMAAVRRGAHTGFHGALVAINTSIEPRPALSVYQRELYDGMRRRAAALGYTLELCWVGPHAVTLPRLSAILSTRNVSGVLIMPLPEPADFSELEWTQLTGVAFDHSVSAPALHTVLPDHHLSLWAALERLAARGYTRPGLVVTRARDARVKYKWSAAFGSFHQGRGLAVPLLIEHELCRENFLRWFRRHRPDVIIGHLQAEVSRWLREIGLEIPRDVGFVQLNWTERSAACAGLDLQPALLGRTAVDFVVGQVQRDERGIAEHPQTIALTARWVEGPTLRPQIATSAERAPCHHGLHTPGLRPEASGGRGARARLKGIGENAAPARRQKNGALLFSRL